jgi:hypothetical protein
VTGDNPSSDNEAYNSDLSETMHQDLGDELLKWAEKNWSLNITSKTLNQKTRLTDFDFILGSSPACDIVVEDKGIAGNHVVFIREEHGLRMINVSGKRNVFINGQPAAVKDILIPGDTVTIKTCEILLEEE